MPSKTKSEVPRWLFRWRAIMSHLLEFVFTTQQAVLFYSATALRPRLKDAILRLYFEPCSAVTMLYHSGSHGSVLGTPAEQVPVRSSSLRSHRRSGNQSLRCSGSSHQDLRQLRFSLGTDANRGGTGGGSQGQSQREDAPRAHGGTEAAGDPAEVQGEGRRRTKRRSLGKIITALLGLLQGRASGRMAPPPPPSTTPTIPNRTTALFRMNGQRRMQQRQWRSTTPASSDTDAMSTTSRRSQASGAANWGRPQYQNGAYLGQEEMDAILIAQNEDINRMEERMNRDDWEGEQFDDLPDDMRRQFQEY